MLFGAEAEAGDVEAAPTAFRAPSTFRPPPPPQDAATAPAGIETPVPITSPPEGTPLGSDGTAPEGDTGKAEVDAKPEGDVKLKGAPDNLFEAMVEAEVKRRMHLLEKDKETLLASSVAQAVAHATKEVVTGSPGLRGGGYTTESSSPPAERTFTINGMMMRTTPRSEDEKAEGEVFITKDVRLKLSVETKEKVMSKACASMKTKFQHMDYGKLLDGTGSDLGKMLLAQKTTRDTFASWATSYDTVGIFRMPNLDNFSDPHEVAHAPKLNLLTEYKRVTPTRVFKWQEYIKTRMSAADLESSKWVYCKLENSIEDNLLVQLKQSLERLPSDQVGGVTLWFALAISLDANDHENKKLATDYLASTTLADSTGEDVALHSACFVAAARVLRLCDVPSDLLELYLNSVQNSCHDKFNKIVSAFEGHYHAFNRGGEVSASELLDQLDLFHVKLTAKYRSLLKAKEWTAAVTPSSSSGGYKAALVNRQQTGNSHRGQPSNSQLLRPDPKWQAWFDSRICEKDVNGKPCGGNHPTKYHDDLGARNRPYRPSIGKELPRNRGGRPNSSRSPRFKSPNA